MKVENFSKRYIVRKLCESDVDKIFSLYIKNEMYYKYHPPLPTKQSVIDDIFALPPNKSYEDKFYLGYFSDDNLLAVMDLIKAYPDEKTAFIGLFMLDVKCQGKGLGKRLIEECFAYLKLCGFEKVSLGYVKQNPQAKAFWNKFGFSKVNEKVVDDCDIVVLEKQI